MALFSKPPAKKPDVATGPKARPAAAGARPVSARQLVTEAVAGPKSKRGLSPGRAPQQRAKSNVIEWTPATPATPAIELASPSAGLCAVLENAALLFASGQAAEARSILEDGVAHDAEARTSVLAWLALFDLLQRAGDRAGFDDLALEFVVQFERSPPAWEEQGRAHAPRHPVAAGGQLALAGKLTAASVAELDGLKRARARDAAPIRLDVGRITEVDDAGARVLAEALVHARRHGVSVVVEGAQMLRPTLESAANEGRAAGEGPWLLLLELLQWLGDQAGFDDRAIEFAVTFEVSPPSWEPPAGLVPPAPAEASASDADADVLAWSDTITHAAAQLVPELMSFAQPRSAVVLDLSRVARIDFVSAGALVNAVQRLQAQRKAVEIVGASAILRALLLLVGMAPDLLARRAV